MDELEHCRQLESTSVQGWHVPFSLKYPVLQRVHPLPVYSGPQIWQRGSAKPMAQTEQLSPLEHWRQLALMLLQFRQRRAGAAAEL